MRQFLKGQVLLTFCRGALLLMVANGAIADSTLILPLQVGGQQIQAEVAHTPEARARGLMFRQALPQNQGMLFVYPEPGPHAMWMRNTPIGLSVAFVDANGVILNIRTMKPFSTDTHTAAGDALYALEMNAGWFEQRGISKGERVEGLSRAPAGE
jgi:uncharacterized membrane protein (UPF0127 family)